MQDSLQQILSNPEIVSVLIDVGLFALVAVFPASAGAVMTLRKVKRAALTRSYHTVLAEVAPLFDQLPIANQEIKKLAAQMGHDAVEQALTRLEEKRGDHVV